MICVVCFLRWFKYALKGQKLSSTRQLTKLLPLQGALLNASIPRALPWAGSFCPFRAYGASSSFSDCENQALLPDSMNQALLSKSCESCSFPKTIIPLLYRFSALLYHFALLLYLYNLIFPDVWKRFFYSLFLHCFSERLSGGSLSLVLFLI